MHDYYNKLKKYLDITNVIKLVKTKEKVFADKNYISLNWMIGIKKSFF
jgi:hypothetical protein